MESVAHCFHNARLLKNAHAFVRGELWTLNDKIVTAETAKAQSSRVIRHNCYNRIIAPGFIDIQVNGAYGEDFSAADDIEAALKNCSRLITQTGCTAYCPTIITSAPEEYKRRLTKIPYRKGSAENGATVLGIHAEGPFISMAKRGCHPPALVRDIPPMDTLEQAKEFLDTVYGPDRSNLVLVTLAPEHPGALQCTRQLANEGIVVSLGHSSSNHDRGCEALKMGASCLTHLFSAMNSFGHHEPSLPGLISSNVTLGDRTTKLTTFDQSEYVWDGANNTTPKAVDIPRIDSLGSITQENMVPTPEVSSGGLVRSALPSSDVTSEASYYCPRSLYYGLIADCIHTHPLSLKIAYYLNKHGLCLITDAMAALGLPDGEYRLGETEVVVGGSPRKALKKGTDTLAGVVASIDSCVRLFAQHTQCGLPYALTAASLHPARLLGIQATKGHLHPGADADFVIVDDEVIVHQTWVSGELVYNRAAGRITTQFNYEVNAMTHIIPEDAIATY